MISMPVSFYLFLFFFNDTATTEIYTLSYTLSLHDALPIAAGSTLSRVSPSTSMVVTQSPSRRRSEEHTSELQSHSEISYAVFCLKKNKQMADAGLFLIGARAGFTANALVFAAILRRSARPVILSFFFNDTATTETYTLSYTLSLHDALPISSRRRHTRFLNVTGVLVCRLLLEIGRADRKSTRLNSSHIQKSRMPSSA